MPIEVANPPVNGRWRIFKPGLATRLHMIGVMSIVVAFAGGLTLISELGAISTMSARLHAEAHAVGTALRDVRTEVAGIQDGLRSLASDASPAEAAQVFREIAAHDARIGALFDVALAGSDDGSRAKIARSRDLVAAWRADFDSALSRGAAAAQVAGGADRLAAIYTALDALTAAADKRGAAIAAAISETERRASRTSLLALIAGAMAVLGFTALVARSILRPLGRLSEAAEALAMRGSQEAHGADQADVTGRLARALAAIERRALAALRAHAALDAASAAVAITDADLSIVFANPALREILKAGEDHWRGRLPGFAAESIIGASVEDLRIDPEINRTGLKTMTARRQVEIAFGGVVARLDVTPVEIDGVRQGYVLQLTDHTAERAAEKQIDGVVTAVAAGDFSVRVEARCPSRFVAAAAAGMNGVCDNVEIFLGDIDQALAGLARGDLRSAVKGDYVGRLGEIALRVDQTAEEIDKLVRKIMSATVGINRASAEISEGANDLSSRAESQASSLQQTAATMEEIAATVKTNAENASHADRLAGETRTEAERGRAVTAETVQAMANIRESAAEISEIVSTIDAIAFQTNLLALNAAVEAARAGDAGKGFAVVASEVRTLAQRSGEAARTIKELIGKSTDHVATGDRLVGSTDAALAGIVDGVRNVAVRIEEIASASREQTSGVDEVSASVSQMDEMTQQNASMADESAAAARSLTEQSEALIGLVRFFTTRETSADAPAVAEVKAWERDAAEEARSALRPPRPRPGAASAASDWSEF